MKTAILTAYLLTAKPDTIPYLPQPYYSEDTLYTNRELRSVNHKNAAKLKDAERNSLSVFLVGIILGIVGGLGVAITIR